MLKGWLGMLRLQGLYRRNLRIFTSLILEEATILRQIAWLGTLAVGHPKSNDFNAFS